jgi:hypothetical protein
LAIRWKIPNWAARRLRLESLSSRLIAAAAVWTLLGLVVGGAVLSNAFRVAAQNNFDAVLQADMDGLIAAAEPDPNGGVMLADRFLNPKFYRVYSGLYYQIKAGSSGGQISRSLFDREINPVNPSKKGPLTWANAVGPENQQLRVVARRVDLTPDLNSDADYTFLVGRAICPRWNGRPRNSTTPVLVFPAFGLGLDRRHSGAGESRPCCPCARSARAWRKSATARRAGWTDIFPPKSRRLATELNSLIQHSEEVVGRARTPCFQLGAFSQDTALGLGGRSRGA